MTAWKVAAHHSENNTNNDLIIIVIILELLFVGRWCFVENWVKIA